MATQGCVTFTSLPPPELIIIRALFVSPLLHTFNIQLVSVWNICFKYQFEIFLSFALSTSTFIFINIYLCRTLFLPGFIHFSICPLCSIKTVSRFKLSTFRLGKLFSHNFPCKTSRQLYKSSAQRDDDIRKDTAQRCCQKIGKNCD